MSTLIQKFKIEPVTQELILENWVTNAPIHPVQVSLKERN